MSSRHSHLRETSLHVDDLAASKAFYQGLFGLTVALEEDGLVGLELPGGAVLLLFTRDPGRAAAFGPVSDGSGARHVRFEVPQGSLGEWQRHLMVHGVVVESQGGDTLYFRDLDGHSLEMTAATAVS